MDRRRRRLVCVASRWVWSYKVFFVVLSSNDFRYMDILMSQIYKVRALCASLTLLALPTIGAHAQVEVQRYNATSESGYGIVYNLPETELELSAVVVEHEYTPGVHHRWASKYLGIMPESQPTRWHEITQVEVRTVGVPNTQAQYLVAFDRKSIAPFVQLASGNILYSINGQQPPQPTKQWGELPGSITPDRAMPALPREYTLATTSAQRALVAATYIYDLRENALSVVTGDAEQMPKDGEAMRLALEHLKREEARTLRLFLGDTTTRVRRHSWRIVPEGSDMNDRTLFRFSRHWGVLPSGDLSGDAVAFSLTALERAPEATDERDTKRRDKPEGIAYNLPGSAELKVWVGSRELLRERVKLTQLGTVQYLSKRMFNIKDGATTAIYFSPTTGELERITNE